jgi:hypothetical protein
MIFSRGSGGRATTASGQADGTNLSSGAGLDSGPARQFRWAVAVVVTFALILAGLFAASASQQRWPVFSVLLMLEAASTAVGGLLGFLFGIPRSLQDRGAAEHPSPGGNESPHAYAVNTNLEQISDWLTKILVGIGLVQIARAPSAIGRLIGSLARDLGGRPIDRLVVGTVLVFFPIFGFLISYLLTRLLLRRAFTLADLSAVSVIATQAARTQVRYQEQKDAEAVSLIANQLNPPPGTAPPTQQQLDSALSAASPSLRSQVFSQARDQRASHWQDSDKTVMMRTIPVFRALIAADPESHRNHGQLGYAFKDRQPPDLDGAQRELDLAIGLRDSQGQDGWLYYELNRAALNIKRDSSKLAAGEPVAPDVRTAILNDLRAAARNDHLRKRMIYDDPEIQHWLRARAPESSDLMPEHHVAEIAGG